MSKRVKRIVSASVAAAVLAASAGYAVIGTTEKEVIADAEEKIAGELQNALEDSISFSTEGVDKEETVYVIADADGNVTKKIVSDWVKNKEGADKLEDKSDLADIENVKSDIEYETGSENKIIWNAAGSDVYYQGTTEKALPVDVKLTYTLDGKEMTANEIAGKSGKVKIKFEYTNNTKRQVEIGGRKQDIYVPFTMISGMMLSNDNFTNVEVSNGKIINDADKSIVVGFAFSGLNEDLALNSIIDMKKLNIPDSFEVTADVKDFSLMMTLTMASSELLGNVEFDGVGTINDLQKKVDELVSSATKLADGASQISEGLASLKTQYGMFDGKVGELTAGISKVDGYMQQLDEKIIKYVEGVNTAKEGVERIAAGLDGEEGAVEGGKQLAEGAATLDSGLSELQNKVGDEDKKDTIVGGMSTLAGAANQIVEAVGSQEDADNYNTDTLSGAVSSINTGAGQLAEKVAGLCKSVGSSDADEIAKDVAKGIPETLAGGMRLLFTSTVALDTSLGKIITAYYGTDDAPGIVNGMQALVNAIGDKKTADKTDTLVGAVTAVDAGVSNIQTGIGTMKTSLETQKNEYQTKADQLNQALKAIASTGIDPATKTAAAPEAVEKYKELYIQAQTAATTLEQVIGKLNESGIEEGLTALKAGSKGVKEGTIELSKSAATLNTGVNSVGEALNQLSKDGTSKVSKLAGGLNDKMPALTSGVELLSTKLGELSAGTSKLNTSVSTLSARTVEFATGMNTLNSNMPDLKTGVDNLKAGSEKIKTGTKSLSDGIETMFDAVKNQLQPGMGELYDNGVLLQGAIHDLYTTGTTPLSTGGTQLKEASGKVSDGVNKLKSGSNELSNGLGILKTDVADVAAEKFETDVKPAVDMVESALEAAKEYDIYSMVQDGKTSSVKFIYRTENVGE